MVLREDVWGAAAAPGQPCVDCRRLEAVHIRRLGRNQAAQRPLRPGHPGHGVVVVETCRVRSTGESRDDSVLDPRLCVPLRRFWSYHTLLQRCACVRPKGAGMVLVCKHRQRVVRGARASSRSCCGRRGPPPLYQRRRVRDPVLWKGQVVHFGHRRASHDASGDAELVRRVCEKSYERVLEQGAILGHHLLGGRPSIICSSGPPHVVLRLLPESVRLRHAGVVRARGCDRGHLLRHLLCLAGVLVHRQFPFVAGAAVGCLLPDGLVKSSRPILRGLSQAVVREALERPR
mmetsp:Transcript_7814/g.22327  ORF Transcript_7814/g.22327 Transcript_7814/m.22327 type:complete len:289 (+) Transcript_7814:599-1465(+)